MTGEARTGTNMQDPGRRRGSSNFFKASSSATASRLSPPPSSSSSSFTAGETYRTSSPSRGLVVSDDSRCSVSSSGCYSGRRTTPLLLLILFVLLMSTFSSPTTAINNDGDDDNDNNNQGQWQDVAADDPDVEGSISYYNDNPSVSDGGNLFPHSLPLQAPSRTRGVNVDADDLIISGDGENCYDDEDCSTYPTDSSNTDDLITPRIVVVNQRPPYSQVEHAFRTSTIRPGMSSTTPCTSDDEECYEGSGDGDEDDDGDDDDGSSKGGSSTDRLASPRPSISYSWQGLRTPSPTPFYSKPDPTPFEDKSIMFTSKPIPPDPVVAETYTPKSRVTIPPRPTGPRVIIDVPKPHLRERERTTASSPPAHRYLPPPPPQVPASTTTNTYSKNTLFSKSSADRTALVIGVIAVIFLIIVIVASFVVFVRVRYRPLNAMDIPKSIDNRQNYQPTFHAVSGTPSLLLPNSSASITHLNVAGGPPISGDFQPQPPVPILPKKDLKEWYV